MTKRTRADNLNPIVVVKYKSRMNNHAQNRDRRTMTVDVHEAWQTRKHKYHEQCCLTKQQSRDFLPLLQQELMYGRHQWLRLQTQSPTILKNLEQVCYLLRALIPLPVDRIALLHTRRRWIYIWCHQVHDPDPKACDPSSSTQMWFVHTSQHIQQVP